MSKLPPSPFLSNPAAESPPSDTAVASSVLEEAAAGQFTLDEAAFMAAIVDDRPAFLAAPSEAYLDALMDLAAA